MNSDPKEPEFEMNFEMFSVIINNAFNVEIEGLLSKIQNKQEFKNLDSEKARNYLISLVYYLVWEKGNLSQIQDEPIVKEIVIAANIICMNIRNQLDHKSEHSELQDELSKSNVPYQVIKKMIKNLETIYGGTENYGHTNISGGGTYHSMGSSPSGKGSL